MRRPIGSNEIGWLVRLLLRLSDLLNHALFLDGRPLAAPEDPGKVLVGGLRT